MLAIGDGTDCHRRGHEQEQHLSCSEDGTGRCCHYDSGATLIREEGGLLARGDTSLIAYYRRAGKQPPANTDRPELTWRVKWPFSADDPGSFASRFRLSTWRRSPAGTWERRQHRVVLPAADRKLESRSHH